MKRIIIVLSILSFLVIVPELEAQSKEKAGNNPVAEVYYFHNTRRCETCMNVERQSKQALQQLYPQQMKAGKVRFTALNIEEAQGKKEAARLGVEGQCLLVVKDDKKVDLTDKAFLYCNTSPDKLKAALNEAIGKI